MDGQQVCCGKTNIKGDKMFKKVIISSLAIMMISGSLFAAKKSTTTVVLTTKQKAALMFMYQEEKVARDVYITLGKQYPTAKTFANIAVSEQTHADSVEKLCIKYKVDISKVNEATVGEFVLPELQSMYDTLVVQGSTSLKAGLNVGIAIENQDITDVMKYADGMPSDVVKTFTNLLNGSKNHLGAFTKAVAAVK